MNKKIVASLVSLTIMLSFIVIIIEIAQVVDAPTIWYVDDVPGSGGPEDPPEDFTSIQDAINASNDGYTVFVYNGTYYEDVVVNKTINLTGENRDNTTIDGGGVGDTLVITADWVNLTGFTITGGGSSSGNSGVHIYSDNITIVHNNFIKNNKHGIKLQFSNDTIIYNNIFSSNQGGIYTSYSCHNFIVNNTISDGIDGIGLGDYSHYNIIANNTVYYTAGTGISCSYCRYNSIINNFISLGNSIGIALGNSNDIVVINNTIFRINNWGITLDSSHDTKIYHNNLIANGKQARDYFGTGNQWDDGYPSGGNYWSDLDEPDEGAYDDYFGPNQNIEGSDGIVDRGSLMGGGKKPYVIDFGSQDNYPLINPVGDTLFLYNGWNLISLPFIQSDTNLDVALSSIRGSYDAVQWYNASDNSDHWKHNSTKKPYQLNDLSSINHSMGFWIHIIEPRGVLFEYNGTQPTVNQTISLHPGWNLVGYPSLKSYNRTNGLNNLTFGSEVDSIWTYNVATQKWKELGPSDYFELGQGYWIHAKTKCEWEVPL